MAGVRNSVLPAQHHAAMCCHTSGYKSTSSSSKVAKADSIRQNQALHTVHMVLQGCCWTGSNIMHDAHQLASVVDELQLRLLPHLLVLLHELANTTSSWLCFCQECGTESR
jgi:hypothetical protein